MTSLNSAKVYQPSILAKIDAEQLILVKSEPHCFLNSPLHSHSVERCVKLVTEASTKVVGEERRHQHILSVLDFETRKIRKACDTKRDFSYENIE